jgi:hypothetical protein
MEKSITYIGEGIDRLITLDVRARGVIYNLYNAARELVGAPLTLTAAQRICEAMRRGGSVIITTGFIVLPKRVQETDGPPGAAALAKCLNVAFDAHPILLIEEQSRGIMASTLRALELNVKTSEEEFRAGERNSALILSFPLELRIAEREAVRILDEFKPTLIIAIEKAGRNIKGEYHTMRGMNISSFHAKIEPLIEEARKRRILTIGIGDGGNEVGMGNIRDAVEKFVPYAKVCQCGCGGGIAAESKVDVLVTAAISNWGAYGIEACIAALQGRIEALHTPEEEEKMLKYSLESGAVDSFTGRQEPSVDGVPLKVHKSLIRILEGLIGK